MKNNPAWIILIISIIVAFIFGIIENSNNTPKTVENNQENKIVKRTNTQIEKNRISDKNKKEDIDKSRVNDKISKKEKIDKNKEKDRISKKEEHKKATLPPTSVKPAKEELVKIVKEKKKIANNKVLLLNDYKNGEKITGKIESHTYFVQPNQVSTTTKFDIKKDITIVTKNTINEISYGKVLFDSFIESGTIDTKYGKKNRERNVRGLKEHKRKRANLDEFIFSSHYIKNNAIPEMPSKPIGIGDTWKQDIYTEIILDKNFTITYTYKLTKFIKINGKECAEISVTANQNSIKDSEKSNVELKVNGLIYCDKSNGRIIKYNTKLEAKVPISEKSSAHLEGTIINKFELK